MLQPKTREAAIAGGKVLAPNYEQRLAWTEDPLRDHWYRSETTYLEHFKTFQPAFAVNISSLDPGGEDLLGQQTFFVGEVEGELKIVTIGRFEEW